MVKAGRSRVLRLLPGVAAVLALGLSGCAETQLVSHVGKQAARQSVPTQPPRSEGVYKVGNPYQVAGVWYYPKEDPTYDDTGIASWYGPDFHGKPTANGETFDQNDLTAAHQTLPMPSLVRITNLENGRSLVVRVNDRGPFVNGRIIDVSRRTAQLLGFERQGTAKVRVQTIGPATGDTMIARPKAPGDKPPVAAAPRGSVTAEALPPPPGARGQTPTVIASAGTGPSAAALLAGTNGGFGKAQAATPAELGKQTLRVVPVRATSIFIQAGSFTRYDNAHRLSAKLSPYGATNVNRVAVNGTEYFRVRLGPLASVVEADRTLAALLAGGNTDAKIVVD